MFQPLVESARKRVAAASIFGKYLTELDVVVNWPAMLRRQAAG
jgi:hypothetical protein